MLRPMTKLQGALRPGASRRARRSIGLGCCGPGGNLSLLRSYGIHDSRFVRERAGIVSSAASGWGQEHSIPNQALSTPGQCDLNPRVLTINQHLLAQRTCSAASIRIGELHFQFTCGLSAQIHSESRFRMRKIPVMRKIPSRESFVAFWSWIIFQRKSNDDGPSIRVTAHRDCRADFASCCACPLCCSRSQSAAYPLFISGKRSLRFPPSSRSHCLSLDLGSKGQTTNSSPFWMKRWLKWPRYKKGTPLFCVCVAVSRIPGRRYPVKIRCLRSRNIFHKCIFSHSQSARHPHKPGPCCTLSSGRASFLVPLAMLGSCCNGPVEKWS